MLSFQIILSLRFTILTLFYFILFITHHLNGCEKFCDKIITLEILSNIIYNIPTLKKRRSITRIYEFGAKMHMLCYWRAESTSIIGQPKSTYGRGITCCLKILIISILLAFKACVYFHFSSLHFNFFPCLICIHIGLLYFKISNLAYYVLFNFLFGFLCFKIFIFIFNFSP